MSKTADPGKRFQPQGMVILHVDREIIVIDKSSGLLTVGTGRQRERTAHSLLNDYVRKGNPRSKERVFIVHRLDRETSGLLVFARSEESKAVLQQNWEETQKSYLAVVYGRMNPREGTITSFLCENAAHRVYSTPDATNGKLSRTAFRVLRESREYSLLEIDLLTGRKHQIRVHLSDQGHPILGDDKYGRANEPRRRLALHSRSISFQHPLSGKRLSFTTDIPEYFTRLIGK